MKSALPVDAGALVLVALARVASKRTGVAGLMRLAQRLSPPRALLPSGVHVSASRLELATFRASRVVPGASCLHRATAARIWLALQGESANVVVGFRRRDGELQGHAWLQTTDSTLFRVPGDGYSAVFDEHTIPSDARVPGLRA